MSLDTNLTYEYFLYSNISTKLCIIWLVVLLSLFLIHEIVKDTNKNLHGVSY